jgi:hypothetical protein
MPEIKEKTESPPPRTPADHDERPDRRTAPSEETECPLCTATMRLWAGFYRCPNCGYKESCCF